MLKRTPLKVEAGRRNKGVLEFCRTNERNSCGARHLIGGLIDCVIKFNCSVKLLPTAKKSRAILEKTQKVHWVKSKNRVWVAFPSFQHMSQLYQPVQNNILSNRDKFSHSMTAEFQLGQNWSKFLADL